ncbi:polyadenylate-binding protein-interacting protein 2 isoform X2 [Anopheles ziemanni]|uniref:polyadenylate-binding protein-interacting protein 2 isoform X2 n=1 Tax=Anopheles coustani TaxID=139045 RepID=UPI00265A44CC|nr:polyadenylate-binding protein-interacting protein 2 isoform X2 [Anopheles coustani]XP_058171119.1 polyadenylate-binding protein-interacting protein 2 isoform X2 [Anopheles ziemanni]
MKMKMPDNSIGGSSSNSYTHIAIAVGNALINAGIGGGGGGGGGGQGDGAGTTYFSDPYDSEPESMSTPPNEDHSAGPGDDFAEYMWMENEDEFDEQELQRLEEEELMDQCIEAMILDEMASGERMTTVTGSVPRESLQLDKGSQQHLSKHVNVEQSTLNPLAAEFVPSLRTLMAPISY